MDSPPPPPPRRGTARDGVLRATYNFNVGATKSGSRELSPAGRARRGQGGAGILTVRAGTEAHAAERHQQHYQARQHPGHAASSGVEASARPRLRASSRDSAALPLKAGALGQSRPRPARLMSEGAGPWTPRPRDRTSGCRCGAAFPQRSAGHPRGWGGC